MSNTKLRIKQEWIMDFIRDPVMAAYVILGAELDTFQAARLRMMWFCPNFIDDSGVSTGKTEIAFLFSCLRAILLPMPSHHGSKLTPRLIAVYYQALHTAKKSFWKLWEKYLEKSEILQHELLKYRGKYGKGDESYLCMPFTNGAEVWCPAGDFKNDSSSQASLRFNDLIVDEAKAIDQRSNGLDAQILDRATKLSFNENHPIHANHIALLGHARNPLDSNFYKRRSRPFKRLIADGSQDHAIFSASFRDYDKYPEYRPTKTVRTRKISMSEAEFYRQWEGIWYKGSSTWFNKDQINKCRKDFLPALSLG